MSTEAPPPLPSRHDMDEAVQVIHDNAERLDLFISEGIEDAASIAVATGSTCWAAGSAGSITSSLPLMTISLAGEHSGPVSSIPAADMILAFRYVFGAAAAMLAAAAVCMILMEERVLTGPSTLAE